MAICVQEKHYRESLVENNSKKQRIRRSKRLKNTHTPTTVAKRDGNSHITLEIKNFRHPSEGNVSLPPPASSSVKTTRTTNQYPKTREWFKLNNVETHASPPLHLEKANPSSKSGKDTLALRATVLQFGFGDNRIRKKQKPVNQIRKRHIANSQIRKQNDYLDFSSVLISNKGV